MKVAAGCSLSNRFTAPEPAMKFGARAATSASAFSDFKPDDASALIMPVVALSAAQAPIPGFQAKGFQALHGPDLKRERTYIVSDEMEGRLNLQLGDDNATAWIANAFDEAGLTSAIVGQHGKASYLQPIALVEYQNDPKTSPITLAGGGKTIVWRAAGAVGDGKDDVDLFDEVSAPKFVPSPKVN